MHTRSERFTSATAAATGKDESTIRRAAARGKALGDDLAAIAGTSLDKGAELDALVKMLALAVNPKGLRVPRGSPHARGVVMADISKIARA